ncbi:MAG TPA: hypothetical protein VHT24_14170, partial [Pseudacidobacterium sp.]|nr:hypothetical protein [Pseudacidobacterium sp.]
MRILVFHSVLAKFFGDVCRDIQLHHKDIELYGIVTGHSFRRRVEEGGAFWTSLTSFSDALRSQSLSEPFDLRFLQEMEAKYGRPNLYLFAHADWFAKDFPHQRMMRFLEIAFRFLLQEWERIQPDAVVAEGIDCTLSHILYSIAAKSDRPYICPGAGRFPGRINFLRNPNDRWEQAEMLYEQFLMNGIPNEPREKAEEYLTHIRNQGPVISDLVRVNRHNLVRSGDWRYLFEVFRLFREDPFDYIATPPWSAIQQRLQRVYRSRYSYKQLFQKPDGGDKFFIFPLHVQPEATTLTLAPFCVDQPALIANIAKALPIGYQLYVKEHVMAVGRRSLDEYRRIATTPNVKLIHPDSNVRALIKQSAGVCTIVGTMGFEALMFNKSVITFGRPFYDAS